MSASHSPRTQAILDAVRHGAFTAPEVADALDQRPPDHAWQSLGRTARTGTVRKYLTRLTDSGDLQRLGEGCYRSAQPPLRALLAGSARLTVPATPGSGPGSIRPPSTLDRADQPRDTTPAPRQAPPHVQARQAFDEQTSTDPRAGHMPATDQETTVTTNPTDAPASDRDTQNDPSAAQSVAVPSLRPLLGTCRFAPWPAAVYEALDVVEQGRQRSAELADQRDDALARAAEHDQAATDAVVDGRDAAEHLTAAAQARSRAEQLDRAVLELGRRDVAAVLGVLAAQDVELTARAHAAVAVLRDHEHLLDSLLDQLVEHDGEHWRSLPDWRRKSRARTRESEAENAGDDVLAIRATIDDVPLGFTGLKGNISVGTRGIGTLAGAGGLPPLLEVTTLTGDPAAQDRGPEADQLVDELRAELAQTPGE